MSLLRAASNGESEGDHVSLVAKEGCSRGCSVEYG